jgi:signal transduction histidine kinase
MHLLEDVKRDKETIDKLYQDMKGIDKMKTEFMSVISHELRTPLTPILGYTQFFKDEKFGRLAPEYKESAAVIEREGKHLLSLIDSILDVSRLERGGEITLEKEPVFINVLVNELLEVMRPEIETRQIEVKAELPADLPALQVDPVKIRRLLANLLGNALKFTPRGGKLDVSGALVGGNIEIRVSDNGVGLAKENLDKIFEKFSQIDGSSTRAAGGLGLGLAFAREIVEAHGGQIRAESPGLGLGSTFIFTLPVV